MKKLLALILALTFVMAPLMTGCGNSDKTGNKGSQDTTEENPGKATAEADNTPVKYEIMLQNSFADYPPDGGVAKGALQEAWEKNLGVTNVDYNVIAVPGSDYATKLNAMMSGDDIPDLFQVSVEQLAVLVENGIITPLDDLVEQMPHVQALLEIPSNRIRYDAYAIDGKHYVFPEFAMEGALNGPAINGLGLRTDWLENLGLEVPTTLDELHEVLRAFTFDDPDGNGKNDTYGIGGYANNYFSSIFGAYGIYMNGLNSWTEVDGKLVHSTVLPEVKEVLALLAQWYEEGLIDPDKFIIEKNQAIDKLAAGQIGAYEGSVWNLQEARGAWAKGDPNATCAIITPPAGPNGISGYPVDVVTNNLRAISQNCVDKKGVDRLIKILDWMVDPSDEGGQCMVEYGVENEHYTFDRETNTIDTSILNSDTSIYSLGFSNPIRWLSVIDRRWLPATDPRSVDLATCNTDDNWLVAKFNGTVQAMIDYPDLYSGLWSEYFVKIITGVLPVDAWDDYVKEFYNRGGDEMTEQVNAAWNG